MKEEIIDGKKITTFDSREELKWYFHAKLCHGDSTALYYMEHCVTRKNVNEWLKNTPYRVKTLEEWQKEIENLSLKQLLKYPKWIQKLKETGELPEWWINEEELK